MQTINVWLHQNSHQNLSLGPDGVTLDISQIVI